MPLYEYACKSCERQFEVMQRFADDPLTICEECGGPLEKLLSAPAFQFKGSGWYVTDYADKKKGGGESKSDGKGGDAKGDADGKKSNDKKTDSSSSDSSSTKKSSDSSSSKD